MIKASELFSCPARKSRRFIIDKYAAVFYFRCVTEISIGINKQVGFLFYRNIGPPVPGRYTQLFTQFKNAVCRTAFIVAGNYQGIVDTGVGLRNDYDLESFPFPIYAIYC